MSAEANKVLVRRYREAHNTNNLALLDEVVATDIKSHSGMPGLPSRLQGGKIVDLIRQERGKLGWVSFVSLHETPITARASLRARKDQHLW